MHTFYLRKGKEGDFNVVSEIICYTFLVCSHITTNLSHEAE